MEQRAPDAHAARDPGRPAIVEAAGGRVVAYAELVSRSRALAAGLRADGVAPGATVALMVETRAETLLLAWAAQRSGLRYTMVSTRLTPTEAAHQLRDSEAVALFASRGQAEVAAAALELAPGVSARYAVDDDVPGFQPLPEAGDGDAEVEEVEGVDMLYSSGTTGSPKGVAAALPGTPFGSGTQIADLLRGHWDFGADTVYLSPAPLYHAAPLRFSMATHRFGGTVVLMDRFDPQRCLELIERHRVTHVQMVPTMMVRLLKLDPSLRDRFDLGSLRVLVHAAAPCPPEVKRGMIEWLGPIVHEYYSATENYLFTAIGPEEALRRPGSVGLPLLGTPHVLDRRGEELGPGAVGAIWSEGGAEFEYHRDPEKTAAARDARGWATVGDLGYLDTDGYLFLAGREADLVISGGVNVYPVEVENQLIAHPAVADCAVFGVPDEDLGEELIAVVQPAADAVAGAELEAALREHCRARLASFKCPRRIEFAAELPRLPTGKLLTRKLRSAHRDGRV